MNYPSGKAQRYAWVAPVAAFLAYLPALWYGFVWDDQFAIVNNTGQLTSWASFRKIWFGPYDVTVSMFRPISSAFAFLEFQAFHLHPFGYHLLNALLHAAVCAVVYVLARQFTRSDIAGLCAAVLFAFHPIHIEAVAWISAFAEPLVALFILAGLCSYVRYRRENHAAWLAAVCAFLFGGLLVKENALVLPFLILAYEFTVGDRTTRTRRALLSSFLSITATVSVYLAIRLSVFQHVAPAEVNLPISTMFYTWPSAFLFYVQKLFVPVPTSGFYDQNYVVTAGVRFWRPVALLVLVVWAVVAFSRKSSNRGLILFCWLAIPISLIPFLDLNVFQWREIAHDRFLYLPSVFFCIFLAQLLLVELPLVLSDGQISKRFLGYGMGLTVIYLALLLTQLPPWHDDVAFYAHAHAMSPNNPRPAWGLAETYLMRGNVPAAERVLSQLVQRVPAPKALEQLGQLRMQLGQPVAAEEALRRAIAAAPDRPNLHQELGQCLAAQGRTSEAQAEFAHELQIQHAASNHLE